MAAERSGFQQFVNEQPPPAVAGDFASSNPRASLGGSGGLAFRAAAAQLVIVGNFAWADPVDGLVYGEETADTLLAFVHREQGQTVITDFLGFARDSILAGLPVSLQTRGDFWATFNEAVAVGDTVYADAATGAPTTDDDGGANPDTGFTAKTPVAADAVFTGSIALNTGVLTITAIASGVPVQGQFLSGTNVPKNTRILSQLTGTPGDTGTYQTDNYGRAAVASTTITGVQGKLAKISTW